MIGIIHKVLHDLLLTQGDPSLIERVSQRANIDLSSFRIIDAQPDQDFARLLQIVVEELGMPRAAIINAYADAFLVYAEKLFPEFFRMSVTARDFLVRQPKIHSTLAAGLDSAGERAAVRNKFQVTEVDPNTLAVTYQSVTGLCDLYQALAHKVAQRYGEQLAISVTDCGAGTHCSMQLFFNMPEQSTKCRQCVWRPD